MNNSDRIKSETVRLAPTTEEVKIQLYDLLIQNEDVESACRYMTDAVKDRNGDRTNKDRDFDILKRIEIHHRDEFFRLQNQLTEYFGINLEQVIEDQYEKTEYETSEDEEVDTSETVASIADEITIDYIVNSIGLVIRDDGNTSQISDSAQRKRITLKRLGATIEGNTRIIVEQRVPGFEEGDSITYTVPEAIEINEYNALKWARIHERGETHTYIENFGQYAEIG